MREAKRIQFSGMNNKKVKMLITAFRPQHGREGISMRRWVTELSSPILRLLTCSLHDTNMTTQCF